MIKCRNGSSSSRSFRTVHTTLTVLAYIYTYIDGWFGLVRLRPYIIPRSVRRNSWKWFRLSWHDRLLRRRARPDKINVLGIFNEESNGSKQSRIRIFVVVFVWSTSPITRQTQHYFGQRVDTVRKDGFIATYLLIFITYAMSEKP